MHLRTALSVQSSASNCKQASGRFATVPSIYTQCTSAGRLHTWTNFYAEARLDHWMSDRMLLTWNVCLSKFYLRVATCLCHVFCMHYCKLLVLSVLLRPCQDHASSVCTLLCPRAILVLVFTICPLGLFFFTRIQWWRVCFPPSSGFNFSPGRDRHK